MKKIHYAFMLVLVFHNFALSSYAQNSINDSIRITQALDKIRILEAQISQFKIEQARLTAVQNAIINAQQDSIAKQSKNLYSVMPSISINSSKIKDIEDRKQNADNEIWAKISKNLMYLPTVFKGLNSRLNIIQSTISNEQKNELLLEITNPQSGALGLKLGDKILELLDKEIFDKNKPLPAKKKEFDAYKEKTDKIMFVVDQITKSPVLNSFPGIGSALSMTNLVTGFLRNVSFTDNSITQQEISNFESSINRYMVFYNSLNQNQIQNSYANSQLETKLNVLKKAFYQYLQLSATVLNFNFSGSKEKYPTASAYYTAYIDEFEVYSQNYLNSIKPKDNSGIFTENANRLISLNSDLNQLQQYYNEIKKMYITYLENEDINNAAIEKTLQIAINTGIASEKNIKNTVKRLSKATETSQQSYKTAVNISGLEIEIKRINYKY